MLLKESDDLAGVFQAEAMEVIYRDSKWALKGK